MTENRTFQEMCDFHSVQKFWLQVWHIRSVFGRLYWSFMAWCANSTFTASQSQIPFDVYTYTITHGHFLEFPYHLIKCINCVTSYSMTWIPRPHTPLCLYLYSYVQRSRVLLCVRYLSISTFDSLESEMYEGGGVCVPVPIAFEAVPTGPGPWAEF